jgi:hypothetical protein
MTVEELGRFLNHIDCINCAYYDECCDGKRNCKDGITEWLGQESSRYMSDYIKENNV